MTNEDAHAPCPAFRGHNLSEPFPIGAQGFQAIAEEVRGNATVG